uniref:Uncharacterized protein n=1 Tax=Oncorhynchus tshawytscha TaxID=74940 RepID=A0A8C8IRP0_ONCTS
MYILVTALYMLKPWVRTIFNSILISVAGMAHIMAILHYFEMVHKSYPRLSAPVTAVPMEL